MRKMEANFLIAVLLLSVSIFSMDVSAEGDDIVIESDMTWSDDMSLSQNVRVVNGGSLSLVDSHFTVSNNVQIFVDSSSSLRLVDSEITSDSARRSKYVGSQSDNCIGAKCKDVHSTNTGIFSGRSHGTFWKRD